MARQIPESELEAIEAAVRGHADGVTAEQIEKALKSKIPRRTFQHRVKHLVSRGRLVKEGSGRWTRYLSPERA